jgi:general L-amino acid transport system permease protein
VSGTIINQAGRATQMLLLIMATYLTLSLLISAAMNGLNRLVASRGALR